ncbi:hypothetical protein [Palleronia sp.]|uniref:hypothetical protein n=1 Tax=Palleronia sp. TaxID=1940284 RepID=UPI0035C866B5
MSALLRWFAAQPERPTPTIDIDHDLITVRPHGGRDIRPMDLPYAAQLLLRFDVEAAELRRDIALLQQRDHR